MTLEELIYTRLVQEKELAESLAKYEGVPAVFLQKAPDDKAQGWGVSQYPRADYLVDMTADPERHSSGMVSVNVYSDDTGKPPEELAPLRIVPGEDLVSLYTCTPYGVNSHRLLVRGHRVPYVPELVVENGKTPKAASSWTQHYLTGLGIGLGVLAAAGRVCFFARRRRRG